ncbi:uncharacterized protein LOC135936329 [Cloeon dipterum]|uniref:uncharacterized protein LOC135936329 n=1 Tax=Cloeon dipterum TaxID=197152 RepID=UPI00321F8E4F
MPVPNPGRKCIACKVLNQTMLKARNREEASALRGFCTKWSHEEDSLLLLQLQGGHDMFLSLDAVPVKVKVPINERSQDENYVKQIGDLHVAGRHVLLGCPSLS